MNRGRGWLGAWLSVACAFAQAPPPVLEYTGKPLQVPSACSAEQVQELGLACTAEEPCPVFLDLGGVAAVGTRLFLAGNLHTEDATLESLLLLSEDGGKTWTESHARVRGAALEHLQFHDFQHGWISGGVLGTLPRDPFFLITTDGGKTWRRRRLLDDEKFGTIESFQFRSPQQGLLLVDRVRSGETGARYEVYETMTGGDTWMLREVTRQKPNEPNLRLLPADGFRLRTDPASKAHRVERRTAEGRWQTVASFAVRAGECRPAEPAAPAPTAAPPPPSEPVTAPARPRRAPSLKQP